MQSNHARVLVVLACMLFAASGSAKTYDPWVLLSGRFGGQRQSFSYAAPDVSGAPGVLWVSAKDGGVYRSADCGENWEPANGGLPWGNQVAGGFPGACTGAACTHNVPFMNPPVGQAVGKSGGGLIVHAHRGPDPWYERIADVLWRGGVEGPYFSLNGGDDWISASMSCLPGKGLGHYSGDSDLVDIMASDQGDPFHTIAVRTAIGGTNFEHLGEWWAGEQAGARHTTEASACAPPSPPVPPADFNRKACALRQIAWTDSANALAATNPQVSAAQAQVSAQAASGAFGIESVSTWKYSSLSHLAAPKSDDDAATGLCNPAALNGLPSDKCSPAPDQICHGHGGTSGIAAPTTDVEDGCLAASCNCTDDLVHCKYPDVSSVAIDPRNGYGYASTNTGLLFSVDGGRSWTRDGTNPAPPLAPNAALTTDGSLAGKAARLFTGVATGANTPGVVWEPGGGYDLNKQPQRIVSIGRMSITFHAGEACTNELQILSEVFKGNSAADVTFKRANGLQSRLGTLVAYLPVTWDADDPSLGGLSTHTVRRSSVFIAYSTPCFEHEGPLTFFDSATREKFVDVAGAVSFATAPELDTFNVPPPIPAGFDPATLQPQKLPRLPTHEQFQASVCWNGDAAEHRCPLTVRAVDSSSRHPQVAYAILSAVPIRLLNFSPHKIDSNLLIV